MSALKFMTCILACVWAVSLLTACGPSSNSTASSSERPAGSRIYNDQAKAAAAIAAAAVTPVSQPTVNGCNLTSTNATNSTEVESILQDLQTKLSAIMQDLSANDQTSLNRDTQALSDEFTSYLKGILDQLAACVPSGTTIPSLGNGQGIGTVTTPNVPNVSNVPTNSPNPGGSNFPNLFGQTSGAR